MAAVAEERQPFGIANDDVELIAVRDEQAQPVGRRVHAVAMDLDAVEARAAIVAQAFVVVARHEHQPRAAAHLVQQGLHHVAVGLRPHRAALDAPEVDDVADQIDGLGLVVLQEIQQRVGAAAAGREVHVGQEQGPAAAAVA